VQKRGRYFSVLKVKINRKTAMKDESVKSKKGTRAAAACSHKQRDKNLDPTTSNKNTVVTHKGIRPSITPRFFQIQSSIMSLAKVFVDLNDVMDTVIKLEGKLNDQDFFNDIKEFATTMMNGFTQATGKALHRLQKSKPSEDTVKQMVKGIPSSLSYKHSANQLFPVQSVMWSSRSVKYLPILAKEGIKHNVGGIDKRGGLLTADPSDGDNWNTL
jgi:hypothetical protein